jgi:hypothetical protein
MEIDFVVFLAFQIFLVEKKKRINKRGRLDKRIIKKEYNQIHFEI